MLRNLIATFRAVFIGIFITCCCLMISRQLWRITLTSKDCLRQPSSLRGRLQVDFSPENVSYRHSTVFKGEVREGGWWLPNDCIPKTKVAVLVPYRNRPKQLQVFLNHIHPLFQRQRLAYRVFVVEQAGNASFNKGAIYNIGFDESQIFGKFNCYIFHDVDLLSENDHNYYGCPMSPIHMCPYIDKFKYILSYPNSIGGVQALTKEHYIKINGYSNSFWGWGAEDDDFFLRIEEKKLKLFRPSEEVGRYKMNQNAHYRSNAWSQINGKQLKNRERRTSTDGLNSIHTLSYQVEHKIELLYTLISIDLSPS